MKISAGASVATVRATLEELSWLDQFLTFTTNVYVGGARKEVSNKFLAFERFPVGLVPLVADNAGPAGISVDVTDTRGSAPSINPAADISWLHDFQRKAVEKCLKATRGIVSSPTGSGKGEMITAVAWLVDCSWLVLVHRSHLIDDLRTRFEARTGEVAGRIDSAGLHPGRVVFATFSAVRAGLRGDAAPGIFAFLSSVSGLIVDEAHTVAADTFSKVAASCTSTYYRLGFSGTPFDRSDLRSIVVVANIGPKIYAIKTQLLIERGFIPRAIINMVECEQDSGKSATYTQVYANNVIKSVKRNDLAVRILQSCDKPSIAFVKIKKHGIQLMRMARAAGINAEFVDGSVSEQKKATIISAVKRGSCDLLISTVVFQDGLNVPELRSVVNLAAGKSTIEILQRIGRGMRKMNADDNHFEVWDIYDKVKEAPAKPLFFRGRMSFGRRRWLEDHAEARMEAVCKQGHTVTIIKDLDDRK